MTSICRGPREVQIGAHGWAHGVVRPDYDFRVMTVIFEPRGFGVLVSELGAAPDDSGLHSWSVPAGSPANVVQCRTVM